MQRKQGFTLVELLTVVLIIGILTSLALPQYKRAIQKAKVTEAISMLTTINASADRLAQQFGYRNLTNFASGNDSGYLSFRRMDMFDEDTVPCTFTDTQMDCENFTYSILRQNGNIHVRAESKFSSSNVVLDTTDGGDVRCLSSQEVCDLYGITKQEE